jgi:EmrB/QacA subfamily drug resistance transporter
MPRRTLPETSSAPMASLPGMKPPCDDAAIRSAPADSPCRPQSGPWILAAAILGTSMAFIDSTVVNVALPALESSFKAGIIDVQWVVESYGLFLGALILVGGAAGDRFGRRKVFLTGIALFALASAACGMAQSIHQLIAARALQGIGAALLTPGSLAIISASFPEAERGRAIGTWSGFSAITTALGPVLGGWLIQHATWRWIFFINLPLAAAVILISIVHVPESRGPLAKRLDLLGALLAIIGLGGLVFGLIESPRLGWTNLEVSGSLLIAIVSLISFPFVEGRAPSPMVPLTLFRSRTFSGANLLTLFLYAALGIFFFIFPMNLIQVQGYSATAAGAAALPLILLIFFLSRWSGGLVSRYGAKPPLIIGPLIAAAGFALFTVPGVGSSYWKSFFPAFIVLGFGMAVSVAPLTTAVMGTVDQKFAGAASGINNAVARVAGLLAIAVFGILMVNAFATRLDRQLAYLNFPPSARQQLLSNRTMLAAIDPPSGLDPAQTANAKISIDNSFLFAFRLVTFCCAALSIASAVTATLIIEGPANHQKTFSR